MKPSNYQLLVVSPFPPNTLLRDTFTYVTSVKSAKEAVVRLQTQQQQHRDSTNTPDRPTLLLLIDMENEQDNIISLKLLIYHLRQGTVGNFVPLVCCANDSSDYMLACIHNGAADYLLKPLSLNVIQTMFLAAHRYSPPQRLLPSPTSSTASLKSDLPQAVQSECHHYHQLKQIFNHHDEIYQAVINLHADSKRPKKEFDLASLSTDRKAGLERRLREWGFNPFDLSDLDLVYCVSWIFDQAFLLPDLAPFRLSSADFISDLWHGYHTTNPYHNFYHAVDVLQSMYYLVSRMGFLHKHPPTTTSRLHNRITSIDILALFLICIGHDLGHPGVTNAFMVNASTSLSLLFNDTSVLESYHAVLLYRLIKTYWSDTLGGQLGALFRKRVVKGVIATDMALHQDYTTKLKTFDQTSSGDKEGKTNDEEEEERVLIYAALIKCADISNIARPFEVAKVWANRLVEELQCQGQLEAELGLPSCLNGFGLPLNSKGQIPLAAFQDQFITKVGAGFFDIVGSIVPDLKDWAHMARQNALLWQQQESLNSVLP